ncbi:hypothetical protein GGX14DRAFT_579670 [Mycena pura]|uniref:Uncharacterized protein n=1 Tax=Mycena pura TaxID=153505 RepID=A0AAD6XWN9_9AGAR|nr:hypothetical protein GGX14DRAFT_579670 [Mycena pura]
MPSAFLVSVAISHNVDIFCIVAHTLHRLVLVNLCTRTPHPPGARVPDIGPALLVVIVTAQPSHAHAPYLSRRPAPAPYRHASYAPSFKITNPLFTRHTLFPHLLPNRRTSVPASQQSLPYPLAPAPHFALGIVEATPLVTSRRTPTSIIIHTPPYFQSRNRSGKVPAQPNLFRDGRRLSEVEEDGPKVGRRGRRTDDRDAEQRCRVPLGDQRVGLSLVEDGGLGFSSCAAPFATPDARFQTISDDEEKKTRQG